MTAGMRWPLAAAALFCSASWWVPANAHPHGWIDVQSTVVFDGEGRITGLRLDWVFDDFYSVFVMDEISVDPRQQAEVLAEIARQDLENLSEYGYFTDLRVDGTRVDTGVVEQFDIDLRGMRLWLQFTVPLEAPVDPRTQEVVFGIYDPTYFLEVLHVEDQAVILAGAGADNCQSRIEEPNPTFEMVSLAASLDQSESAGDTLGELFAEWVSVQCE